MESKILTKMNFNKLKNEVKENKDNFLIFNSDDDELNRKVIEKLDVNVLLVNLLGRKDFQKQRNSGFNQVMAKVMKKKNIVLGINFEEILECKSLREKSDIFARIRQDVFLCKKNNVKMKFIFLDEKNSRNVYDLKSLGLVLGMDTKMVKEL
jgi:RNase P/RNase MRP subunit p30